MSPKSPRLVVKAVPVGRVPRPTGSAEPLEGCGQCLSLTVDSELFLTAWQEAGTFKANYFAGFLGIEDRLTFGEWAVLVHGPAEKPWDVVCDRCGGGYPCWLASLGMGLLKAGGWEPSDVLDLIEAFQAGGRW